MSKTKDLSPHYNTDLEDIDNEVWKDIEGYEDCYQVSTLGRVKSLTRLLPTHNGHRTLTGRIMKQHLTWEGKMASVGLSLEGSNTKHFVANLVFQAFVRPLETGESVVFKNGRKKDCRVENLVPKIHRRIRTMDSKLLRFAVTKGFDWMEYYTHGNGYVEKRQSLTPSLLKEWLRDKHNIDVVVSRSSDGKDYQFRCDFYNDVTETTFEGKTYFTPAHTHAEGFSDYFIAEEAGLARALKTIENASR